MPTSSNHLLSIKIRLTIASALLLTVINSAHGKDTVLSEDDYLNDQPMISSASHFPQKRRNVPGSVSIITQEMIRASGALELVEVMRLVPGMQSSYQNGSRFGIGYHEIGNLYPNRMEIKLDGHSVYDVFTNGAEWQSLGIEIDDIDYIEVVRTPNTSADGTNAFQGTLNIITKSPVGNTTKNLRADIGDQTTRNSSFISNDKLGAIDSRLTLRYRHNEGFEELPADVGDDGSESSQLGWRGISAIDLNNNIEVQLQYSDSNVGLRDSNDAEFLPRNYTYNYQFIRWEHTASSNYKQELLFYRNELELEEEDEVENFSTILINEGIPPAFVPVALGALGINDGPLDMRNIGKGQRNDLEWRHTHYLQAVTLNWGIGARHDSIEDQYILGTDAPIDEEAQRAFINSEWAISKTTILNGGVIQEHNSTIGGHHSSRLGLNQHVGEQHTFRLIGSRATRAPSNVEFNRQGNIIVDNTLIRVDTATDKSMDAESLHNYELGYLGNFADKALQIDVKLFREIYRDLLDRRDASQPQNAAEYNLGGVPDPVNLIGNSSELDNEGVEIEIDYRPDNQWLLRGHYSWQNLEGYRLRAADDDFPDINTPVKMNSELPDQSGSLLVMWSPVPEWETSLHYTYIAATDYFDGNLIDDQDRLDARIARNINLGKQQLTLALIGQNIVKHNPSYEYFDSNLFDTRFYLRTSLEF
jgi:iron complex outermembrane receptor protein